MVTELPADLKKTEDEIAEARILDARLEGGLLKALVAVRLEILAITRALLRQRIMAEAGGAPLAIQIPTTTPDPQLAADIAREIETQQQALDAARAEAARFSGGLVHALKLSTVATHEQSLSMLRQRFLVARYGLHVPSVRDPKPPTIPATHAPVASGATLQQPGGRILQVRLLRKQYTEQNHQDYIFFDVEFTASGLKRTARAIKGELRLNDLFGESKMIIGWTLDKPLRPGETLVEKGQGFEYNQFMQPHQWVNSTALDSMSATFEVSSILYSDGTREDLS